MAQRIEVPGMGIVEFPDGMSDADIAAAIKKNMPDAPQAAPREMGGLLPAGGMRQMLEELKNSIPAQAVAGSLSGASRIGNTILRATGFGNEERSRSLQDWRTENASAPVAQGADLLTQIAGTAGVGGTLAKGVGVVAPRAVPLMEALASGGFKAGGMTGPAGLAVRSLGGAATGAAAAGLVDPSTAGTGAIIGGALPGAAQAAGAVGKAVGAGARKAFGQVSPEVAALADKAKALGIDVPADRLVDSKPLDALASGLNYVPFSGRAATEARLNSQLNRAVSRTFGQNDTNVTFALRKAETVLGGKFDDFLKTNTVQLDQKLLEDLAAASNQAAKELGSDGASIIAKQVDEIVAKGANGVIDGQAAYNIKRTLDRIGRRNSPEAWYAIDLKQKLMEALDRSVGEQKAKGFAELRQQYGNMLSLQKLAKNGVEGEISAARIANLPNINNPQLQEVADIAAQFVKPREAQHGAMQRAIVGGAGMTAGAATLGLPGVVGAAGASVVGRGANKALESELLKNLLLNRPNQGPGFLNNQLLYRAAPLIPAQ